LNNAQKLIFSKLMTGLWPNFEAVSDRTVQCIQASENREDFKKFQTTGTDIAIKK